MCGIAGILDRDGSPLAPDAPARLRHMARQLERRGPDEERTHCEGPLGFVFRRLSIVDLAGGSQPMSNEDGTLRLMVNGEIYNHLELRRRLEGRHSFRSRSDSEVILHLYEEEGLGFLEHLNGMYALALWDQRRQRLVLARDRLGVKPLYYHPGKTELLFASEIKALLADPHCPRSFDWHAALSHRSLNVLGLPGGRLPSFFEGIELLPAGHLLVADLRDGAVDVKKYWELPVLTDEEAAADQRSEQQVVEGYRELLQDAVRLQLMGDVELGIFLSGGLDSSAIAALAAPSGRFHTFTVLGQSTYTNGDAKAAHQVAEHFGLPNHQVLFNWHQSAFTHSDWKRLLWLCETPLCNAEQLYKYELHRYARATRPELKVVLLGQGSDELNGGYSRFWIRHLPEEQQSWTEFVRHFGVLMQRRELVLYGPRYLESLETRFDPPILRQAVLAALAGRDERGGGPWSSIARRSLLNLDLYNLWHEDRTAASNSIENRVPFLDHRLVEYLARIPGRLHEAMFWEKRILRRAMARHLPESLVQRPKVGFFYGEDERYTRRMMYGLLTADAGALVEEAFGSPEAVHPVLDRLALGALLSRIPEDPEYGGVDDLLALTNMGLLERMAREVPDLKELPEPVEVLPAVAIEDWGAQEASLKLRLAARREMDLDRPLGLAPNVRLVREAGPGCEKAPLLLAVDDVLTYTLEPSELGSWIDVLERLDGKRSLREVLAELELPEAAIRKHLEEALDFEVVELLA
jgi:asparagine synthase (glutamine-hydrolysing)